MKKENLELPRLSGGERDRRFAEVRRLMRESGVDFLLVRGNSARWDSASANMRYLTQIGGNGEEGYVIFPLKGDPVCLVWFDLLVDWWKRAQDWVSDIRGGGHVIHNVVSVLRDLGLTRGRCGVVGLASERDPDGIFSYRAFSGLEKAFPEIRFVNATALMEKVRLRKSLEEISFISQAAEIGDRAIETMLHTAKPGIRENEIYGEMVCTMLKEGAEYPIMLIWESGEKPTHAAWHVTQRVLREGDLVVNEISPKYGGYWAHPHHPFVVGKPKAEAQKMFDICLEAFQRGMEVLRAGVSLRDVEEAVTRPIRKAGYTWTHPVFHGMGLGQIEGPYSGFPGYEAQMSSDEFPLRLEEDSFAEGMVIALQPIVATQDRTFGVPLSDTVVIEKKKARRLSKRPLELTRVET